MKTNASMTIYAKSITDGEETWTRTEVTEVQWENAKAARVARSGDMESDKVVVFVSLSQGEISVQPGDYLVRGIVTDEISSSFTVSALRAKYPNCAVVRSADFLDFGSVELHHWEIGAN